MPTLHWLTRDEDLKAAGRAPHRLLEPVPELSAGDPDSGNLLIQGDNLDALKALLPFYAGRVKCIAIDPPYNTRSAFTHYDDNLEHTTWLAMMYPRLELLRDLLAEDGSIWVCIDDNEAHYLKVVMDEVFGRGNFIGAPTWLKTTSVHNNAEHFSSQTDTILSYAKNMTMCRFNRVPRSDRNRSDYSNPDEDPRGAWSSSPLHVSLTSGQRGASFARTGKSSGLFPIIGPHGQEVMPPKGRCWGYSEESIKRLQEQGLIWWGPMGKNQPRLKRFLKEQQEGVVPTTFWNSQDVGHNQEAKADIAAIFHENADVFSTPKPERLMQRIIIISTNVGDMVLDSFLGSGTTTAVAHKMGRRWIGIEMGEHAVTHCVPRMRKVIEGEQGGISEAMGWKGGGGFRFHRLGPAVFDESGRLNSAIKFAQLAAHVWFAETGRPWDGGKKRSPLLGVHEGRAVYLLYNGILGDKAVDGGNVLTKRLLRDLPPHSGPKTIFAECSRLSDETMREHQVAFKQIPYEVKAR